MRLRVLQCLYSSYYNETLRSGPIIINWKPYFRLKNSLSLWSWVLSCKGAEKRHLWGAFRLNSFFRSCVYHNMFRNLKKSTFIVAGENAYRYILSLYLQEKKCKFKIYIVIYTCVFVLFYHHKLWFHYS